MGFLLQWIKKDSQLYNSLDSFTTRCVLNYTVILKSRGYEGDMAFQIEKNTGILIKKAARLFEQFANKSLDTLGVTYSQTIFLIRLWEKDGQNQIELTKSAGLKQPTVVRMLDRMERDGLVKRVRNDGDRRIYNFFLTEKAKKACKKLEGHAYAMQAIATKKLLKNEINNLNVLLTKVIGNVDKFLKD